MAENHNQSKEIKQNKAQSNKLLKFLRSSIADEISAALISTILISLISFILDAASLATLFENLFADWIKPYITIIISVATLAITLLIVINGAMRLSSYRLKERQQNILNLREKESDFFGIIEKDISLLIQER